MKQVSEDLVREAVANGWSEVDARRGYAIFCSEYGGGAEHIERIDEMMMFDSDDEAAEQAERDGIKIIRDIDLPEDDRAAYIDTPENRRILENYIKSLNK